MEAVFWLEDYLAQWSKILFFVSHSQDFMNGVCTHIVRCRRGVPEIAQIRETKHPLHCEMETNRLDGVRPPQHPRTTRNRRYAGSTSTRKNWIIIRAIMILMFASGPSGTTSSNGSTTPSSATSPKLKTLLHGYKRRPKRLKIENETTHVIARWPRVAFPRTGSATAPSRWSGRRSRARNYCKKSSRRG